MPDALRRNHEPSAFVVRWWRTWCHLCGARWWTWPLKRCPVEECSETRAQIDHAHQIERSIFGDEIPVEWLPVRRKA